MDRSTSLLLLGSVASCIQPRCVRRLERRGGVAGERGSRGLAVGSATLCSHRPEVFFDGGFGAVPEHIYPDALLPIASREASHAPLCGAMPAPAEHIIDEGVKVAAKPTTSQDWILASVVQKSEIPCGCSWGWF